MSLPAIRQPCAPSSTAIPTRCRRRGVATPATATCTSPRSAPTTACAMGVCWRMASCSNHGIREDPVERLRAPGSRSRRPRQRLSAHRVERRAAHLALRVHARRGRGGGGAHRPARRGRRSRAAGRPGAGARPGDTRAPRGAGGHLAQPRRRRAPATGWRRSSSASTRPTCSRPATPSSHASSRST